MTQIVTDLLAQKPTIRHKHSLRWLVIAIAAVLVAQYIHGLVVNPFYQWHRFAYWFARPVIVRGLVVTLEATAASAVLSLIGGVIVALFRLSSNAFLSTIGWVYVWFFRSIPNIVILLFIFNSSAIYPHLNFGIPFWHSFFQINSSKVPYFVFGVVGLTISEIAYAAEVIRSGVLSVDQGQIEAATALGLSKWRQLQRVILPQALRSIVPSYVNLLIGLIKVSSLLYYVSLLDLFGSVQEMGSTYPGDIVPLLVVGSVWYVILTSVISVIQFYVERYFARGAVRTLPPTPIEKFKRQVQDAYYSITRKGAR